MPAVQNKKRIMLQDCCSKLLKKETQVTFSIKAAVNTKIKEEMEQNSSIKASVIRR
jgi:hypothetical protein